MVKRKYGRVRSLEIDGGGSGIMTFGLVDWGAKTGKGSRTYGTKCEGIIGMDVVIVGMGCMNY